MASQAQIDANRKNASKSTGPRTPQGKARSASNSTRHGLTSSTPLAWHPQEQAAFEALTHQLFEECQPKTEAERQAFQRYAFSTFQVHRAQRFELEAQIRWTEDPDNETRFTQMEGLTKLTATLERRAAAAFKDLQKLQADRLSSMDIHNELYLLGKKADVPVSLPICMLRRQHASLGSAQSVAAMILTSHPEVWAIIDNRT